jgi:RND family efflux transporter MFP subunit
VTRSYIESRGNPTAAESAETVIDMEGRLVGSGETLGGVVDTSEVLIRCDVTSKDIGRVREGQKVLAYVYSDREVGVEGEVIDVSPIMNIDTKAFKVDIAVPNEDEILRAGMLARVNIVTETRRDALVVDRDVVQRRNNQEIVFVVDDEERADKRVLEIGLSNPDEVEVVGGLREGERLVTLGYETLQDGVKVQIIERELEAPEATPAQAELAGDGDGATTRSAARSADRPEA